MSGDLSIQRAMNFVVAAQEGKVAETPRSPTEMKTDSACKRILNQMANKPEINKEEFYKQVHAELGQVGQRTNMTEAQFKIIVSNAAKKAVQGAKDQQQVSTPITHAVVQKTQTKPSEIAKPPPESETTTSEPPPETPTKTPESSRETSSPKTEPKPELNWREKDALRKADYAAKHAELARELRADTEKVISTPLGLNTNDLKSLLRPNDKRLNLLQNGDKKGFVASLNNNELERILTLKAKDTFGGFKQEEHRRESAAEIISLMTPEQLKTALKESTKFKELLMDKEIAAHASDKLTPGQFSLIAKNTTNIDELKVLQMLVGKITKKEHIHRGDKEENIKKDTESLEKLNRVCRMIDGAAVNTIMNKAKSDNKEFLDEYNAASPEKQKELTALKIVSEENTKVLDGLKESFAKLSFAFTGKFDLKNEFDKKLA